MQRSSRKHIWPWALSVLLLVAALASPPARTQYHKWRLESVKARKTRLMASNPSALDKFWLFVGNPISGQELDATIRHHERALVRLDFLVREKLPAEMTSCPQTMQMLDDLRNQCPWYRAETVSGTNMVITTCPKMLARWQERAKELGWSIPKS